MDKNLINTFKGSIKPYMEICAQYGLEGCLRECPLSDNGNCALRLIVGSSLYPDEWRDDYGTEK